MTSYIRVQNNSTRQLNIHVPVNTDVRKSEKVKLVRGMNRVKEEFWQKAIQNRVVKMWIDDGTITPLDLIKVKDKPKPPQAEGGKRRGRPPKKQAEEAQTDTSPAETMPPDDEPAVSNG